MSLSNFHKAAHLTITPEKKPPWRCEYLGTLNFFGYLNNGLPMIITVAMALKVVRSLNSAMVNYSYTVIIPTTTKEKETFF